MFGLRAVSILLLCLALICQQVQAQAQVFIVKGTYYHDGIYTEEGEGSNLRYKRMGGATNNGNYLYLYRGTERADTWLVGYGTRTTENGRRYGTTFEGRIASLRAPARGAEDRLPPEEGWQYVYDQYDWSRDGGESRYDEPDMRVTGFNLKEATADEMFQRGGE